MKNIWNSSSICKNKLHSRLYPEHVSRTFYNFNIKTTLYVTLLHKIQNEFNEDYSIFKIIDFLEKFLLRENNMVLDLRSHVQQICWNNLRTWGLGLCSVDIGCGLDCVFLNHQKTFDTAQYQWLLKNWWFMEWEGILEIWLLLSWEI